jgi:hypothetical protein
VHVGASVGQATVPGLTNGTPYTFTVTATNPIGTGPASAASNTVVPLGQASAPLNVVAVAGNAQATVTWSPPADNGGSAVTGYTVVAWPGGLTKDVGPSPTQTVFTGLTNGTTYTFNVYATTGFGGGLLSAASNAVTVTDGSRYTALPPARVLDTR